MHKSTIERLNRAGARNLQKIIRNHKIVLFIDFGCSHTKIVFFLSPVRRSLHKQSFHKTFCRCPINVSANFKTLKVFFSGFFQPLDLGQVQEPQMDIKACKKFRKHTLLT